MISLYCLLEVVYYPLAVYVSHYCYKNFKNHFQGNNQFFPQNANNGNGEGQFIGGNNNQTNYQRMG